MKVRMLKNARVPDRKMGIILDRKAGEEFEVDHDEEKELLYGLITTQRATIIDTRFIPLEGRYKCIHGVSEPGRDGKPLIFTSGEVYTIPQEKACRLMALGFVRPEKEEQWSVKKLMEVEVTDKPVKRMFPDLEPPRKEPWQIRRER